jgi:t-SNARE complex subunit (syntaxin)
MIDDMREKISEINALHQNVKMLFELISELQNIIHSQNEILDSIENNMIETNKNLFIGENNIKYAQNEYMTAQETFCCIFVVLVVLSVIGLNHFLGKMNIF